MNHHNATYQQAPTSSHFSYDVPEQSLENASTSSVSVSATSSGSLEKDFEEFVNAMTLKYGITKKAVVERCGCKTAMFWKSCRGSNGWNQFVSETVKGDNYRTRETGYIGDSNDDGDGNCPTNFPDMDAISTNWKALSEEEKQLYATRAQSFNERNLLEGFLNKDDIEERAAVTEECLNSMQLQVNFLRKRCGIDSFFVFGSEMAFNLLQRTSIIGTKRGFAFLQLLDEPETAQNQNNEFLKRMKQGQGLYEKFKFFLQASVSGLITSSGSTHGAPIAMRTAVARSNGNNEKKQLTSKKLIRKEVTDLLQKALPPHRRTNTIKINWGKLAEDQDEDVKLCGWPVGIPVKDPSGNRKKKC
ncbi:hypothetical protein INT45_004880 [Circinella minor]|uniref:Uncharacterized protein n=1 Tax=Circinella minor TaxID=1195481 RepID=A0A8H7RQ96_9FUNG|nr:hypothetical protein INT45_004880 [Circinella minor]